MGEIVPRKESVFLGALQVAPEAVIEKASDIAKALAEVIKQRKLFIKIGKNEHVFVEGWNTLGAMVGISPIERTVTKHIDGAIIEYEAYVELVRNSDGLVIGGGSAICRTDEKRWADAPLYAVRSMAITRATGKAFRLKLSWIIELAGFSPTPAEEIIDAEISEVPENKQEKSRQAERPLDPETLKSFMDRKVANYLEKGWGTTQEQRGLVVGMLNTCFAGDDNFEESRRSVLLYLFGTTSSKDLTDAQILSLLDWLKPTKDSGGAYSPDAMAAKEAALVLRRHMYKKDSGEID